SLRQPWVNSLHFLSTLKGFLSSRTLFRVNFYFQSFPGLSPPLQPWAGISQRLRRSLLNPCRCLSCPRSTVRLVLRRKKFSRGLRVPLRFVPDLDRSVAACRTCRRRLR